MMKETFSSKNITFKDRTGREIEPANLVLCRLSYKNRVVFGSTTVTTTACKFPSKLNGPFEHISLLSSERLLSMRSIRTLQNRAMSGIGRSTCDPWRLVTTIRGGKPRGKSEGKTIAGKSNKYGGKANPFENNELNWV